MKQKTNRAPIPEAKPLGGNCGCADVRFWVKDDGSVGIAFGNHAADTVSVVVTLSRQRARNLGKKLLKATREPSDG